jgi:hypothetical protein
LNLFPARTYHAKLRPSSNHTACIANRASQKKEGSMTTPRLVIPALGTLILLGASAPPARAQAQSTVDVRYVTNQLSWAFSEISRIEKRIATRCNRRRGLYRRLRRLKRHLRSVMAHVRAGLASAAAVAPTSPAPPQPAEPVVTPMQRRPFHALLRRLKAARFSKGRLSVVSTAAAHNHFSSRQVKRILKQFRFSSKRVKALRVLAPRIVDPQKSFVIYGAFKFSSAKKKARRILRRHLPRSN